MTIRPTRGRSRGKVFPKKRLFILDWYVHQGHQYEFFKTGHNFNLTNIDGAVPAWNVHHRPLNKNVKCIHELNAKQYKYDIIMVRSPLNPKRYTSFVKKKARGIAVVQTTTPFPIPDWVRHVVWNSYVSMKKHKGQFPGRKHYYIPHGYDHNEFRDLGLEKNQRVLTVANAFRKRRGIMGYDIWKHANRELGVCDVFGHGNEDMDGQVKRAGSLSKLVNIYNSYSVFLNTTIESAMPRTRAEAAMCGCPIASTDNYDIGMYFKNGKNAILSNDKDELVKSIKKLLDSKQMQKDYGSMAREVAINNFGIKEYLQRWDVVFRDVMGL